METIHENCKEHMEPTKFQNILVSRAQAAAKWLVRSIEACNGLGSVNFYSRWYHPIRGWGWAYPETTGYIIPSLINYAKFSNRPEYADLAVKQADWLMSLQFDDGAFPAGVVVGGRKAGLSVFNTSQVILGLIAAADYTNDQKYLLSTFRAALWLSSQVDEQAGVWKSYAYVPGFSPAYYTRVCWPMLEVYSRKENAEIKNSALRVLSTIHSWQQENGAIKNWGFKAGHPAFTHTIAYTIRGFLESARLLGNEGERFKQASIKAAELLRRRMEYRGRLAGAYDLQFKGRYWYSCLTGNCQMSLVWMKIYRISSDARYLSAALKALNYVIRHQRISSFDPNAHGAVPGSSPFWGRYLTLRYPNWATKFYLDASLLAYELLQQLLEKGPCGL